MYTHKVQYTPQKFLYNDIIIDLEKMDKNTADSLSDQYDNSEDHVTSTTNVKKVRFFISQYKYSCIDLYSRQAMLVGTFYTHNTYM